MIVENYCVSDWRKKMGMEGEVLPCPVCGRIPVPMVREDSLDGYFAAVSCFAGIGATHAYIKKTDKNDYKTALYKAVEAWNKGGEVDYYERYDNIFRNCYSCKNYDRKKGEKEGKCLKGIIEKPGRGCQEEYARMSHEQWVENLTRK